MTTTIIFANTNDAYLISGDNSYATALAGPADSVSAGGDTNLYIGQQKSGTPYTIWQTLLEFAINPASSSLVTSGYLRLTATTATGTSVSRVLEINKFDFGASITTADWRTPSQLTTLYNTSRLGAVVNVQNAAGLTVRAGHLTLTDLDSAATQRYVAYSSRNRHQNTPTGLEYNGFRSADYSGTDSDPAIFVASLPNSTLNRALGAQAQLSDGSHVFVELSSVVLGTDDNILKHRSVAGAVTTIASSTPGATIRRGAQTYTVVRDRLDNVYLLNQSDTLNNLTARAFIKGSGYTWSAGTGRDGALPNYDSDVNNIAAAWHPAGGTYGTIVALISHQAGSNIDNELVYVLISCDYLINGSGTLFRGSGNAAGLLVANTSEDGFHNPINETGTLMDMSAASENSNKGFIMSTGRHHVLGQSAAPCIATYTLNSSGTGFVSTSAEFSDSTGFSTKDANAKSRVLPISDTQFVTVNAQQDAGFGLVVKHRQQTGTDPIIVLFEQDMDGEGIGQMAPAATLAVNNDWDAIYNPRDNKVWLYYLDTANNRRLMRTAIDMSTGFPDQTEIEVNNSVGATGSSNLAIRVHRGAMTGEQVLISVANRTSGGTYSTVYVADTINIAPSQPTLITRANFDSNSSALFDWNFIDLNVGDTQSAFEFEIYNDTTGASAYDTGKVVNVNSNFTLPASSIPNEQNYRWRVRTWDSHDAVSPWSDYGFFTCSAAGVVNITNPAVDNDPNVVTANTTLTWSVSGTTQAAYKIVITVVSSGATFLDTGWVSSTATSYLIQGLASDIQYNVALTVRDAALVQSNTANRKITPSYARPEVPIISFDIEDDLGYIGLSITNPDPVGDRPNPTVNQIHRRVYNASNPNTAYQLLGETTAPNGVFLDYTAASGVLYEYRVRAVAGQFFTDSTPTVADRELALQGIWLHDPTDAAGSIKQFLYGKDNRSTGLDVVSTVQQFAGRTFPVVDFGEHELEDISATVNIPHGPDHYTEEANIRAFMELKRTLFFRDNRGRAAYGTMSGYNQSDQAWGVTVAFKFGRVSYDIEEV